MRGSLTAPGSVTDRDDAAVAAVDCRADTEPRHAGCGEPRVCIELYVRHCSSERLKERRAAAPIYVPERNWNPDKPFVRSLLTGTLKTRGLTVL
ncbi:hypothetical protein HPB50_016550 [Hyalomma asiaticum]|uniref:Uncharacterized protein n=1 Tax=Hyalomma asiaticum TaxID=266040 RepID=A0ACB7SZB4_HYAAI|nr:hypothetical protein HPB50_016550 [Hyalomma asiaticum]